MLDNLASPSLRASNSQPLVPQQPSRLKHPVLSSREPHTHVQKCSSFGGLIPSLQPSILFPQGSNRDFHKKTTHRTRGSHSAHKLEAETGMNVFTKIVIVTQKNADLPNICHFEFVNSVNKYEEMNIYLCCCFFPPSVPQAERDGLACQNSSFHSGHLASPLCLYVPTEQLIGRPAGKKERPGLPEGKPLQRNPWCHR